MRQHSTEEAAAEVYYDGGSYLYDVKFQMDAGTERRQAGRQDENSHFI